MSQIISDSPNLKYHKNDIFIPEDTVENFIPLNQLEFEELNDSGLLLSGRSFLTQGYRVCRKASRFDFVLMVVGGSGVCSLEGNWRIMRRGDIFTAPTRTAQLYGTDGEWEIIWFHIKHGSALSFSSSPVIVSNLQVVEAMEIAYQGVLVENKQFSLNKSVIPYYCRIILQKVQDVFSDVIAKSSYEPRELAVQMMKHRIKQDIEHMWSVSELADLIHVSPSHLYKVTKQYMNSSPLDYVRSVKMEWGKEIVIHSDLSFQQIAYQLGYENAYSFSKAFKKVYGKSPSHFRKNV